MARGFGSTFGVNTTDIITTSAVTLSTSISIAAWVWINGHGGGSLGRIFDNGNNTFLADNQATVSNTLLYSSGGWSTTQGSWRFANPGLSAWKHIGVTHDLTSAANTPLVYINGVSVSLTSVVAPVGTNTQTSNSIAIGNRASDSARNWDGIIAQFAIWTTPVLKVNLFKGMTAGTSPLQANAVKVQMYLPLYGTESGEPDWGPSHFTQTITGTAYQNGPPAMALYPLLSTG